MYLLVTILSSDLSSKSLFEDYEKMFIALTLPKTTFSRNYEEQNALRMTNSKKCVTYLKGLIPSEEIQACKI